MRLVAAMFVCLLLIAPATANAETVPALGFLTSGGVLGIATTFGGITTYVGLSVNIPRREKVLRRYLDENRPAVRQALALGGTDVMDDLAVILNVEPEHLDVLGKRLRLRRRDLLAAAYEQHDVDLWFEVAELVDQS